MNASALIEQFEAMTSDQRHVVYSVALALAAVGLVVGLWLAAEWGQLMKLLSRLMVLGVIGAAVWWFGFRVPPAPAVASPASPSKSNAPPGAPLPSAGLPPPAAAVTTPTPRPATGAGFWWE